MIVEITFENLDFIDIPKDCFEIIEINESSVYLKLFHSSDKPLCEFEGDVFFNGSDTLFDRLARKDITHIAVKLGERTLRENSVPWEDGKSSYENRLQKCLIHTNGDLSVEIVG